MEVLLTSGADIGEINAVRNTVQTSRRGDQLAAAATPTRVVELVFSDVVGNRLNVIASGPLTPDGSSFADAVAVIDRYEVHVPDAVLTRLLRGSEGELPEPPRPGDPIFESVSQYVLADGDTALCGAGEVAWATGYEPLVLSSRTRGEAREAAKVLKGIAEESGDTGIRIEPPAVLLSRGETTVTIRGNGVGGPNHEFVLSAALELSEPNFTVASVDTDGIDGTSSAAGAIATAEIAEPRPEARSVLLDNDAGGFLDERDALIRTGATGTNVNDLRLLVTPAE